MTRETDDTKNDRLNTSVAVVQVQIGLGELLVSDSSASVVLLRVGRHVFGAIWADHLLVLLYPRWCANVASDAPPYLPNGRSIRRKSGREFPARLSLTLALRGLSKAACRRSKRSVDALSQRPSACRWAGSRCSSIVST